MNKLTNGILVGAAVGLMAGGAAALLTKGRSCRCGKMKRSAQKAVHAAGLMLDDVLSILR